MELLPKHISPHSPSIQCIRDLRPEQIKAQIERIKLFRVRKPGVYVSHYDTYLQSMKQQNGIGASVSSHQFPSWMDTNFLWKERRDTTIEFPETEDVRNHIDSSRNLNLHNSATQSSSISSSYIDPDFVDLNFTNDMGRKALSQAFQNLTADMATMTSVIGQQSSLVNDFNKSIKSQKSVLEDLNRKWSALKRVVETQSAQDESFGGNNSNSNSTNDNSIHLSRVNSMSNDQTSSASSSYSFNFGDQNEADIICGMNKIADANRQDAMQGGRFTDTVPQHQPQPLPYQQPRQMNSRQSGAGAGGDAAAAAASSSMSRRELAMMNEMRVQMNIHRQLLMKKRNQILLHSSSDFYSGDSSNYNSNNGIYNSSINSSSSMYSGDNRADVGSNSNNSVWPTRHPSLYSQSSSSMNNNIPHHSGIAQHSYHQHLQSATKNEGSSMKHLPWELDLLQQNVREDFQPGSSSSSSAAPPFASTTNTTATTSAFQSLEPLRSAGSSADNLALRTIDDLWAPIDDQNVYENDLFSFLTDDIVNSFLDYSTTSGSKQQQ